MAKERQQMERQVAVGRQDNLQEPVGILLEKLILIFLYDGAKPVTVVVQEYADDGYSSQNVALSLCE